MAEGFSPAHSGKYGRLFTDGDVGDVLAAVLTPDQLAQVDLNELGARYTFPVGEPLFVLRGRDSLAAQALEAYREAVEVEATPEFHDEVAHALAGFAQWQDE